jgi:hypothetical protein
MNQCLNELIHELVIKAMSVTAIYDVNQEQDILDKAKELTTEYEDKVIDCILHDGLVG